MCAVVQEKEGVDDQAKLGMVAIHLGLQDEAATLFQTGQHWGFLNALYQAMGRCEYH